MPVEKRVLFFSMRTPLPIVDERTAKVRVENRSLKPDV